MIVSVVHKRQDIVLISVARSKFGAACSIALETDAEYLGLKSDKNLALVIVHGEDLIQTLRISLTGSQPVGGNILIAVGDPYIHFAVRIKLICKILGYLYTLLAVVDPEITDLLLGTGERKPVHHHLM